MKGDIITFKDFTTFRAMASGAIVKYHDCDAPVKIGAITASGNRLQCRKLWDASRGEFRRVQLAPLSRLVRAKLGLSQKGDFLGERYSFGDETHQGYIAFETDLYWGDTARRRFSKARLERIERLRSLFDEFKENVNADIARCRVESEVLEFSYGSDEMELWNSPHIELLVRSIRALDMQLQDCESSLNLLCDHARDVYVSPTL